jgi:hypothetical protein
MFVKIRMRGGRMEPCSFAVADFVSTVMMFRVLYREEIS